MFDSMILITKISNSLKEFIKSNYNNNIIEIQNNDWEEKESESGFNKVKSEENLENKIKIKKEELNNIKIILKETNLLAKIKEKEKQIIE